MAKIQNAELPRARHAAAAVFWLLLSLLDAGPAKADAVPKRLTLNSAVAQPLTNDSKTGFLDIIATEAFKRNGLQLTLVQLPPERGLRNANAGIDDGELVRVGGMERLYPNLVPVPEKMMEQEFVAFTKNPSITIDGWDSLKPFSIGYIKGWKIYEINVPQGTDVIQVTDAEQLFSLLDKGRIDVALYTRYMGLEIIRHRQIAGARYMFPPLATKAMFMYLHESHANLVPGITSALATMKAQGIYQREFDKIKAAYAGMQ